MLGKGPGRLLKIIRQILAYYFSTVRALFDSYWDWSNRTYTLTNQPTLASLPSTIRPLEVWFCWTSRVECSMGRIDLWPGQRASGWASEQTVNVELCAHFYENQSFHREVRDPLFDVCAPHSFEGSSAAVWSPCANQFRKQFFSTHRRMRKKTSAPRECTAPNLMDFEWSSMLFSLSKPSQSMRMVLVFDCSNFEAEKTSALCTLNFYDVQCTTAKRRSPWGNPKNRGKPQESANQRARYF